MIAPADVCDSLEVRLPIADVLVVKTVNNVFAHDQIWDLRVAMTGQQIRRNQIRLLNLGIFIAAANRAQYLFTQPAQVRLELCQHSRGCEIPGERLMTMK